MLSDTESKTISASAGLAWANGQNGSISELLNHADAALYEVKNSTKGTFAEYGQQPE